MLFSEQNDNDKLKNVSAGVAWHAHHQDSPDITIKICSKARLRPLNKRTHKTIIVHFAV